MRGEAFLERLEEAAGPIVVKEVRQGLRSNAFVVFFTLLLVGCLFMALLAAALPAGGGTGPAFFAAYLIALGVVCYFVIPYSAFRSMVREREEETWVLLALTGLPAVSVVRGKVGSALAQAMLYASACAPFVVLTYFLNGVSIVQVAVALALSWTWTFFLVAVAVTLGTLGETRAGRGLTHFLVLGLLAVGSAVAFGFTGVFATEGGGAAGEPEFWGAVGSALVLALAAGLVVLEGAAANLALPSEAGLARRPRLAVAGYVGLMVAGGGAVLASGGRWRDVVASSLFAHLALTLAGVFLISEADGFPRSAGGRGILRPGALRSYLWLLLLFAGSTGAWAALAWPARADSVRLVVAGPLYAVLYLSAAAVLGRVLPVGRATRAAMIRATFLVLVGLGSGLPPMLASAFGHRWDHRVWNALNPILGLASLERLSSSSRNGLRLLLGLAGATALAVLLALAVLRAKDKVRA